VQRRASDTRVRAAVTDSSRSSAANPAAATGAQAVDRAASLLVHVLGATGPVPFPDLVAATGLPKSTVSRLLSSLERSRLISRTDSGEVIAGDVITAFARSHSSEDDLVSLARPALQRLSEATGETINLAVPTETGVVQIDQVDARFLLGAANWLQQEVPYHASAVGKVLLAHGSALPVGRLAKLTDRTRTTRTALEADLHKYLELGYAVADGELEPGLVAIAAPVLDSSGRAIAALCVSGPSSRLTARTIARVGQLLVDECTSLSSTLSQPSPVRRITRKAGAA